jgi:hypothetical protein
MTINVCPSCYLILCLSMYAIAVADFFFSHLM